MNYLVNINLSLTLLLWQGMQQNFICTKENKTVRTPPIPFQCACPEHGTEFVTPRSPSSILPSSPDQKHPVSNCTLLSQDGDSFLNYARVSFFLSEMWVFRSSPSLQVLPNHEHQEVEVFIYMFWALFKLLLAQPH